MFSGLALKSWRQKTVQRSRSNLPTDRGMTRLTERQDWRTLLAVQSGTGFQILPSLV